MPQEKPRSLRESISPTSPPPGARKPRYDPEKGIWFDGLNHFDIDRANHAVGFIQECCFHSKAEWAGKPFILEVWQDDIISAVFGWIRPDGKTRRFRTAYLEMPRKQGKSLLASAVAAYMLFADGENAPEVVSAAADKNQAALVFEATKSSIEASSFRPYCKIFRRSITPNTGGIYKVLSADIPTKYGMSPSCIIFDELHTQPDRGLWDALKSGVSARRQPLLFAITTAGHDRHSLCAEQHIYAEKVLAGIIEDDSYFAAIYGAGKDDDWTSEEVWRKANPNLGISKRLDYMREACKEAQENPSALNSFLQFDLDVWTAQAKMWMPMAKWDACGTVPVDPEALKGRACYGGLDLSTSLDISALALLFPEDGGGYSLLCRFWVPEENIAKRARRDKVPYDVWVRQGLIRATQGDIIDYDVIRHDIVGLSEAYEIKELAYDRWNSSQIVSQLVGDGLTMVEFGQGFVSMASPTKRLMEIVLKKQLRHGNNAVLRWMASNVSVKTDAAANEKPDKARSQERIDGIVATVMALGRAEVHTPEDDFDPYDTRGVLVL
jgi:phage terminase large subunit-like protein